MHRDMLFRLREFCLTRIFVKSFLLRVAFRLWDLYPYAHF